MRQTLLTPKTQSATGVVGGILHGMVSVIFFGGIAGPIVGIPKYLDRPEELTALKIGVFYGMVLGLFVGACLGAIVGFVNKRTREAIRPALVAASIFGLVAGLLVAAILMWHRMDLDSHFHHERTLDEYVVLSVILVVLLSAMGAILAVSLGWSITLAIRSHRGFFTRLLNGSWSGAVAGCVSGFVVLTIGYFILRPMISGYGGW